MLDLRNLDFDSFIKKNVINNIKKLRGKYPPITENVDNKPYSLSVDGIYDLNRTLKNFFLIILKNYVKKPKLRYFLSISIANNSSDFLVLLARELALKHGSKLIQYSIYPKNLRIQLLCIKEIKNEQEYQDSVRILRSIRNAFREKLKNLV
ncbi:MAG: hypothetical protein ACFFE4_06110 [Candidatus Thorarchaeota archaeon]